MEMLNQILTASVDISKIKTIGAAVLGVVVGIGAIVCIIFLSLNGVKLAKSEDDEQITLAKKRVKYCILGLVLCVAAGTIGGIIIGLAEKIFK